MSNPIYFDFFFPSFKKLLHLSGVPYAMQIPVPHPYAYSMVSPLGHPLSTDVNSSFMIPTSYPNAMFTSTSPTSGPASGVNASANSDQPLQQHAPAAPAAGAVPAPPDDEFNENPRNERQNPWWLLFKLSFLVYIFSQNAGIQRIIMLNCVAMVIFLYQMGRIRIIRFPVKNFLFIYNFIYYYFFNSSKKIFLKGS